MSEAINDESNEISRAITRAGGLLTHALKETQKRRYVAVIDILGFKELLNPKGHFGPDPVQKLKYFYVGLLYAALHKVGRNARSAKKYLSQESHDDIGFAVFSDTILLWSAVFEDGMSEAEAAINSIRFFDSLSEILKESLHRLPMRAGVAFGDVLIDKSASVFLGQPIVDAHLLETAQDWIGAACHFSCHKVPAFAEMCKGLFVVYYDVPVKPMVADSVQPSRKMFAVHWAADRFNRDRAIQWLMQHRDKSKGSVYRKYNEALNYILNWGGVIKNDGTIPWFAPDETGTVKQQLPVSP